MFYHQGIEYLGYNRSHNRCPLRESMLQVVAITCIHQDKWHRKGMDDSLNRARKILPLDNQTNSTIDLITENH